VKIAAEQTLIRMDQVFIKEEVDDSYEGDAFTTTSDSYSNSTATSGYTSAQSISVPPTQRVLPTTPSARRGYTQEAELLDKVKKFLCTLITFGEGISASAGGTVRRNVTSLVVGSIPVPEFLRQLQLVTSFPVRPFVLPFLQSNIPRLREEVQRLAMTAGCSPSNYLTNNESLLEPSDPHFSPKANEIFHCEPSMDSKPPGLKRKGPEIEHTRTKQPRAQPSLISPPLLPTGPSFQLYKPNNNLAMVPGYPHDPQNGAGSATTQDTGASQEDEWKNIKVMLNCISGMVEKTQSAISILQQRQVEVANIRTAEELVAEAQAKANLAIMEVKQAALDEIREAKNRQRTETQNNCKEESCWNCGRQATETCSGCSLARYCGPFCQHKDWEDHSRVCRPDLTMEDHSRMQRGVAGSPPARERAGDAPARTDLSS